jgi:hypothetical protein
VGPFFFFKPPFFLSLRFSFFFFFSLEKINIHALYGFVNIFSDDDAYLDSDASQSLGEITLVILSGHAKEEQDTWSASAPEEGIVHERSKKAVSHRVK